MVQPINRKDALQLRRADALFSVMFIPSGLNQIARLRFL
jgi:hypothetical protein